MHSLRNGNPTGPIFPTTSELFVVPPINLALTMWFSLNDNLGLLRRTQALRYIPDVNDFFPKQWPEICTEYRERKTNRRLRHDGAARNDSAMATRTSVRNGVNSDPRVGAHRIYSDFGRISLQLDGSRRCHPRPPHVWHAGDYDRLPPPVNTSGIYLPEVVRAHVGRAGDLYPAGFASSLGCHSSRSSQTLGRTTRSALPFGQSDLGPHGLVVLCQSRPRQCEPIREVCT